MNMNANRNEMTFLMCFFDALNQLFSPYFVFILSTTVQVVFELLPLEMLFHSEAPQFSVDSVEGATQLLCE